MSKATTKPLPMPCVAYMRCTPPPEAQHSKARWWRYELRTRSGLNKATGMRSGSEVELRLWLEQVQHKMEIRERPFGPTWRAKLLRAQEVACLPAA